MVKIANADLRASALACLLLAVAACGPPAELGRGGASNPDQSGQAAPPKTLTMAIRQEPADLADMAGQSNPTAAGASNAGPIVSDSLARTDANDVRHAQIAVELPSVDKGTWRLNADGPMDMTWTLRPNVRWHDGAPFAAAAAVFSFNVRRDPDIGLVNAGQGRSDLMESVAAPDPHTLVVHWSSTYVYADREGLGVFLPHHLLEDLYRADKAAFLNSPLLGPDFIGTGPYRLVRWERGSHMEFVRFDDYYPGRPLLDRVVLRFVNDPNTMVANILAGTVDLVLAVGVDLDAALEVKRRWEGTGNQVIVGTTNRLQQLELQYRPDVARPRNGLTNRMVRQAFYHALDRQTLVDVLTHGLAPIADSWIPPSHVLRPHVESAVPRFAYDPSRATQLLAEAGWTRGTDGVLVHQPSGERFELEVWGRPVSEREATVIADQWKTIGAQTSIQITPTARLNDRAYESLHTGPLVTATVYRAFSDTRLHSRYTASEANNWATPNRGAYNNPRVDAVLDRLSIAIDPREQVPLHQQLLQEQMGDVALMPLYWEVVPALALREVRGPIVVSSTMTGNIFEWHKD